MACIAFMYCMYVAHDDIFECTSKSNCTTDESQCTSDGDCMIEQSCALESCQACAANCKTCVTAGAGKCDTCNDGYIVKASDQTCAAITITNHLNVPHLIFELNNYLRLKEI